MQSQYAPGTLRHKLFGHGDRLPDRHPAARYRGAFLASTASASTASASTAAPQPA
jgi:hypothetical protein